MARKDIRIPVDAVTVPRDGEVKHDRWWVVDNDCIIVYQGFSPQCSRYRELVERIVADKWPGAEVRHLPAVYLGPVSFEGDYMRLVPA